MTTIHDGPHLMVAAQSDKTPGVPPGHFRICTVRYATYQFAPGEFDQTKWQVHNANSEEARRIAELVNMPPSYEGELGLVELRQFAQLRHPTTKPLGSDTLVPLGEYLVNHGPDLEPADLALCLKSHLLNSLFPVQLSALRNVALGRLLEQQPEGPAVGVSRQELASLARDWEQEASVRGGTMATTLMKCVKALRELLGNG